MTRALSLVRLLVAFAVVLAIVPASKADTITLGLQESGYNSGNIWTAASSTTGSLVYGGNYGTFTLNQVTATGFPFVDEP